MTRIRFVDRKAEITALLSLAEQGSGVPIYLYGPEGCGKTRLLRELAERLRKHRGYLVAYIDALEENDPSRAVVGSEELRRLLLGALHGLDSGPVGFLLAYAITRILASIEKKIVEDRHIVIVIDDVAQPLGLDRIEAYTKTLLRLVEYDLAEKNPASILVIASTSEGLSLEKLQRHPTWVSLRLLWNLPREGFYELAELLQPPSNSLVEEAWRLTGGNPRALIQIATTYRWSIDTWLADLDANTIVPMLSDIRSRGLIAELGEVVNDPDKIITKANSGLQQLGRILVERNLLVYKAATTLLGDTVPMDRELGIGRYYAWQLPAHRLLLQRHLKQYYTSA